VLEGKAEGGIKRKGRDGIEGRERDGGQMRGTGGEG